jgi:hypothetical protein
MTVEVFLAVKIHAVVLWRHLIWLRHYATSRQIAGSIPDEVIGFFN